LFNLQVDSLSELEQPGLLEAYLDAAGVSHQPSLGCNAVAGLGVGRGRASSPWLAACGIESLAFVRDLQLPGSRADKSDGTENQGGNRRGRSLCGYIQFLLAKSP
jgi:hypothetical protein